MAVKGLSEPQKRIWLYWALQSLKGRAVDKVLWEKIADIEWSVERLSLMQAHDALCLQNKALAMPKLQYILRTSPCAGNPLLSTFDGVLCNDLSKILNIKLNDSQWIQASLPVQMGGLGVRRTCMLAPSAFWSWLQPCSHSRTPFYQNHDTTSRTRWYHSLWHRESLSCTKTNITVGFKTLSELGTHPVACSDYEDLQTSCDMPAASWQGNDESRRSITGWRLAKCATTNGDWPMFVWHISRAIVSKQWSQDTLDILNLTTLFGERWRELKSAT